MRWVVALGGNALLRRTQAPTAEHQLANVQLAAQQLARVAAAHELVITHGNGPQVGLLAMQAAAYAHVVPAYPLDVLDAESAGMLGYLLEQALANLLPPERAVVCLLTRVEVDPQDPAFQHPSKPIGSATIGSQRRLVASPQPLRVPVLPAIGWLLDHGAVVIAGGGGGIPVVRSADGAGLQGVEAVVDKDLCSGLIATGLCADGLLIATDVDAVRLHWGGPDEQVLHHTTPAQLALHDFAAGSMGPKVDAACRFVRATGGRAVIGALGQIEALLAGTAGTQITPDPA
jgi:carbamate kinase